MKNPRAVRVNDRTQYRIMRQTATMESVSPVRAVVHDNKYTRNEGEDNRRKPSKW